MSEIHPYCNKIHSSVDALTPSKCDVCIMFCICSPVGNLETKNSTVQYAVSVLKVFILPFMKTICS